MSVPMIAELTAKILVIDDSAPTRDFLKACLTSAGCEVITKFPAEDLLVAGQRYYTTGGYLPTERDSQSHLNTGS